MIKLILYFIVTIFVIYSMNSLDSNKIFKSSKPVEAKLFYFLFALALIYLVTNLCYDLINIKIF